MRTLKVNAGKALLLIGALYSFSAHAQDVELAPNLLMFSNVSTIVISGPDGFIYRAPASTVGSGSAFIGLGDAGIQADGTYTYEIKNFTSSGVEIVNDPANGRENVPRNLITSAETRSGSFRVENGVIVTDNGETE